MNERYRQELLRNGFPIPKEYRYTVICRWRPPRDQWKVLGSHWRDLSVVMDHTGDSDSVAIDACLYLISRHRGSAIAHHVLDENMVLHAVKHNTEFDWSWYDGVVCWGGEVVDVTKCDILAGRNYAKGG